MEEYIRPLLELAKRSSVHLFLRSCAATFTQSLQLAEALLGTSVPDRLPAPSTATHENGAASDAGLEQVSVFWKARFSKVVTRDACYSTVYQAWELVMNDYLAAERDWIRTEMERVAYKWEEDVSGFCERSFSTSLPEPRLTRDSPTAHSSYPLTSWPTRLPLHEWTLLS